MSMVLDTRKSILWVNSGFGFIFCSLWYFTKCDSYFITKWDKRLTQNASGCLLQNATVLLQIATVITKAVDFITKCDSYHKLQTKENIITTIAIIVHRLVLTILTVRYHNWPNAIEIAFQLHFACRFCIRSSWFLTDKRWIWTRMDYYLTLQT